jgi:hypothetical protein
METIDPITGITPSKASICCLRGLLQRKRTLRMGELREASGPFVNGKAQLANQWSITMFPGTWHSQGMTVRRTEAICIQVC